MYVVIYKFDIHCFILIKIHHALAKGLSIWYILKCYLDLNTNVGFFWLSCSWFDMPTDKQGPSRASEGVASTTLAIVFQLNLYLDSEGPIWHALTTIDEGDDVCKLYMLLSPLDFFKLRNKIYKEKMARSARSHFYCSRTIMDLDPLNL